MCFRFKMFLSQVFLFIVITVLISQTDLAQALKPNQMTGYDVGYELAMDAYRKEKWSQCSEFFKRAIDNYHTHQNTVAECRLKCQPKRNISDSVSLEDVFQDFLQKANCLRFCNKKNFGHRAEVEIPAIITKKFEDRVPYGFLHYCYFQVYLMNVLICNCLGLIFLEQQ